MAGRRPDNYLWVVNQMDENEKNPPAGKRPPPAGKKLHLDLSEAMLTNIDDDEEIIELKEEVVRSPKETKPQIDLPEIDLNDNPPQFSPESARDKPSEGISTDFEALSSELDELENDIREAGNLSFEEEDEDGVEIPFLAAEGPLKAEDANEVMEITEFDDIESEDDNEMVTFIEDREASEPGEEFLELIEVEEGGLPEAGDEKIEEEIIHFDGPKTDIEDIELENFINDSLGEEIQIGDELEDDLIKSLGIEAGSEMRLADQKSGTEEFNFNINTSEISEKIEQLDSIFFDDTQSETQYDHEAALDNEDSDSENENREIRITDPDPLRQPPADLAAPAAKVNPDQIEQSIERFIEQRYSEKIESMITAIIEKVVAKEINRLKSALLEDENAPDF